MTQQQPTSDTRNTYGTMEIQHEQDGYSEAGGDSQYSQETDDDEWEDEDAPNYYGRASGRQTNHWQGENGNVRGPPRKRRKPIRGPRRQTPLLLSPKQFPSNLRQEPQPNVIRDAVVQGALDGTIFTGRYALDVFGRAFHLLRWPLSIFLFLFFLSFITGHISQRVPIALQPLCIIPGFSSFSMCTVGGGRKGTSSKFIPQWADYPKLVEVQSKTFEQLLEETAGGSAMSLEIKKAEMATSDLVTRVRISDLKAKDTLATTLGEFLEDARKTGEGLHKLTSKVAGAVDSIMAVNDYALQSIESARANEPSPWSPRALAIWRDPRSSTKEIVTKTFEEAMNVLSANMKRLVLEAEHSLHNLHSLEERLATLHEVVSRENKTISSAKIELKGEFWNSLFGKNKKALDDFDHDLNLLDGLSIYRKQALINVVATLQTLRAMSEDMEEIRERVAAPHLVGSMVPVEVHIKSIGMGLERLRDGRIRAKRLEEDATRRVFEMKD